jgi:hypothetical protein
VYILGLRRCRRTFPGCVATLSQLKSKIEVIMKNKLVVSLLVVACTSLAAPAFASGYGPAPFYNPLVGAPASQRGQSVQTIAAERASATSDSSYGGANSASSQSGAREPVSAVNEAVSGPGSLFAHH